MARYLFDTDVIIEYLRGKKKRFSFLSLLKVNSVSLL
jgi:predicted nucleic acid-binding protein